MLDVRIYQHTHTWNTMVFSGKGSTIVLSNDPAASTETESGPRSGWADVYLAARAPGIDITSAASTAKLLVVGSFPTNTTIQPWILCLGLCLQKQGKKWKKENILMISYFSLLRYERPGWLYLIYSCLRYAYDVQVNLSNSDSNFSTEVALFAFGSESVSMRFLATGELLQHEYLLILLDVTAVVAWIFAESWPTTILIFF